MNERLDGPIGEREGLSLGVLKALKDNNEVDVRIACRFASND